MMFTSALKKATVVVMMVAVLAPVMPVSAPRAQAQFTVNVNSITDPGWLGFSTYIAGVKGTELTITNVLNGIAWAVAKTAIKSVTRSIVDWINSGFQGSPAFSQNLNQDLRRLADYVAVDFANRLLNELTINSPFLQQAVGYAVLGYYAYTNRDAIARRLAFTLQEYSSNSQAFYRGDFSQGGWNAWFATIGMCGNDPYCARFAAEEELVNEMDRQLRQRLEELSWGGGFLSWRGECLAPATTGGETSLDGTSRESCAKYDVVTPGSLVESALGITATSPLRQLELADSINEIVGALVSQLITQVIGSTGLLGVSQPSQGGGRPPLDIATGGNGVDSNLTTGFDRALEGAKRDITRFRGFWVKLQTEAQVVHDLCDERSTHDEERDRALEILQEAKAEVARADAAAEAVDDLLERVADIRENDDEDQSAAIQRVSDDYNCLLQGGEPAPGDEDARCLATERSVLPNAGEVSQAEREASDVDGSLMHELKQLRQECSRIL